MSQDSDHLVSWNNYTSFLISDQIETKLLSGARFDDDDEVPNVTPTGPTQGVYLS